jgi:murein DD-endopeptidase MepM/ murein hydrolase activator NlpD
MHGGVGLKVLTGGSLRRQLTTLFPDREFIMRSQGQVRFVKISSRFQAVAASVAFVFLVGWLATIIVASAARFSAERERISLLDREAKVVKAESRVQQYRNGLDSVTEDLARRQAFIERMVEAHVGDLPVEEAHDTVSNSSSEAQRTVDKVSSALPEATGLARIEARQLAFVESLTRYADRRATLAAGTIRKLGLNPASLITLMETKEGKGGPLMQLATSSDGSLDPRFQRLGLSLARMDALERGLAGIPQVLPARLDYISSGFGYRTDPFTGGGAFHAGLDFRGPVGAPIYAAAKGVVSFAGRKQGYGNCVEIDHGNGLMTRYAHMSRFGVVAGQSVTAGDSIGAIGSTGRSTGPHLHFEVRIGGRAVNPRPFLEKGRDVRQETLNGA